MRSFRVFLLRLRAQMVESLTVACLIVTGAMVCAGWVTPTLELIR
jgi:hypothetical protein